MSVEKLLNTDALFNEIKENVLNDLKGKTTVTPGELDSILKKHMSVSKSFNFSKQ